MVSRRALAALGIAGLALGLLVTYLVAESDHVQDRGVTAGLGVLVGWSFIGTGLFAWWRRPDNRTGALMTAVGFAWGLSGLTAANNDLLFTIGIVLDGLFAAIAAHLVIAFPSGRLRSRLERGGVAATYFIVTVLQIPSLLFEESLSNLLVIEPDQDLSDALDLVQFVAVIGVIALGLTMLTRRWRAATPPERRTLAPVLWTGGATFLMQAIDISFDGAGEPQKSLEWLSEAMLATVPFGFLAGLLRTRLAHGAAVSELVGRLGEAPGEDELRAALADALGDPSVGLAYWLPDSERFVDAGGRPVALPETGWTAVEVRGSRVAAIVHDPQLADEPQLVRTVGAAAALALENQRLAAELRARIEELRASRARIVEAADAERRRLERDLHDGAQSRLVALALQLRLLRNKLDDQPDLTAMLDESAAELNASLEELRELARGIHPAVLTDRGLEAALQALASRAPVPVEIAYAPPSELSPPVETAIYFVAAEALTNVAKYAHARRATVSVTSGDGTVAVEVADDGRGGAHFAGGSGLRGLADRVAALDGRLELDSPPQGGTRLRAELPVH